VNYLEGQVFVDGQSLSNKQAGDVEMHRDQMLSTERGKAEVLLSPGVFVRVGDNSEIRMVNPELVNPQVEVVKGEAMVEVDMKPKPEHLAIFQRGAETSLLKAGLYRFDADEGKIQVIDGKAQVADNGQTKDIGKGKEIVLNGSNLKPVSFDRKAEDNLYAWSQLRSGYLAEANQETAQTVYLAGGPFWGTGWYWNPYFATWSWLPGDGFFYSPFGYPFFAPAFAFYRAPVVVGGHLAPGAGRLPGSGGVAPHAPIGSSFARGGVMAGGGFHGAMMAGRGFRR
jgi:hypothetical protein